MSTVTQNDSAPQGSSVVCNECEDKDSHVPNRKWDFGGGPHCRGCHSDRHRACAACGACLPDDHRWDRYYCSATCRGQGKRDRGLAALDRAVWETENPEGAAAERAEFKAREEKLRAFAAALGRSPKQRERDAWKAELKARAERCATCDQPFAAGDTIYRRAEHGSDGPVLPYCADHRCPQPDGFHNADLTDGRNYRRCACPGGSGERKWLKPEACASCGRLVCNERDTANPSRFVRDWQTPEEATQRRRLLDECESAEDRYELARELPWGPVVRTFCSGDCRQSLFRAEAKAKREAARGDSTRRCETCRHEFTARAGARYCSSPCRQAAYRHRKART